jgi:hypothetical protein
VKKRAWRLEKQDYPVKRSKADSGSPGITFLMSEILIILPVCD